MKRISASDAKNSFGVLLDDVSALGRVDVLKHGKVVAVVLSPRAFEALLAEGAASNQSAEWGQTHMIPPDRARAARIVSGPDEVDDDG